MKDDKKNMYEYRMQTKKMRRNGKTKEGEKKTPTQ